MCQRGGSLGWVEEPDESLRIRDKLVAIARSNAQNLDAGPCWTYPTKSATGGCVNNCGIHAIDNNLSNGGYQNDIEPVGGRYRRAYRRRRTMSYGRALSSARYPRRRRIMGGAAPNYTVFVKARMKEMRGTDMTPQEKMVEIGKMWRGSRRFKKHKKRYEKYCKATYGLGRRRGGARLY